MLHMAGVGDKLSEQGRNDVNDFRTSSIKAKEKKSKYINGK